MKKIRIYNHQRLVFTEYDEEDIDNSIINRDFYMEIFYKICQYLSYNDVFSINKKFCINLKSKLSY